MSWFSKYSARFECSIDGGHRRSWRRDSFQFPATEGAKEKKTNRAASQLSFHSEPHKLTTMTAVMITRIDTTASGAIACSTASRASPADDADFLSPTSLRGTFASV